MYFNVHNLCNGPLLPYPLGNYDSVRGSIQKVNCRTDGHDVRTMVASLACINSHVALTVVCIFMSW